MTMIWNKQKDNFYNQIFRLVLPIIIQNLLSAAVSSADVVMLNYVGQSSISAVSLASQYASVLFMVFYGLGTGATMLCAQYYGKGDMHTIQVIEGIALRFSVGISMLFAGAAFFLPKQMMRIFTNDQELIAVGTSYLRCMSVCYLCWGITEVYLAALRSVGRVVVSTVMNVLAFSMYSVIIGHLGTDAVAANSFVIVVRNFGTILCFGMASAGGILLGKIIGENHLDEARDGAKKLMKLTVFTGAVGGLIILAAIPVVLSYAQLTAQAMHYLKYMLLINVYYVMGAAVNTTLIAGVFRAGGDSRFGFVCDTIDMWVYAVPLGFFAAFVFKLPVMWVYFLICTDEFVKWPWVIRHYRSGKWLNNITRDDLFLEKKV